MGWCWIWPIGRGRALQRGALGSIPLGAKITTLPLPLSRRDTQPFSHCDRAGGIRLSNRLLWSAIDWRSRHAWPQIQTRPFVCPHLQVLRKIPRHAHVCKVFTFIVKHAAATRVVHGSKTARRANSWRKADETMHGVLIIAKSRKMRNSTRSIFHCGAPTSKFTCP